MKYLKKIGLLALAALFLASCAPRLKPNGNNGLPPGQVKKVTGSKSAKQYAPGQKKKDKIHKHSVKKKKIKKHKER